MDEPFIVCLKKTAPKTWKVEHVARKIALRMNQLGLNAKNAVEELIGE